MTRRNLSLPAILLAVPVSAQTLANQATDPTVLKQIIIYGRHSVRSSTVAAATLATLASRTYPPFEVQPGYLTPHGAQAEILLGSYFRSYLLADGLLTGADEADAQNVYFRANSIQRSNVTAASLATGLLPAAHRAGPFLPAGTNRSGVRSHQRRGRHRRQRARRAGG